VHFYIREANTLLVENLAMLGDEYRTIEIATSLVTRNELVDLGSFRRRRILRGNKGKAEDSQDEGTTPSLIHGREDIRSSTDNATLFRESQSTVFASDAMVSRAIRALG
jgi:hypothetical protein